MTEACSPGEGFCPPDVDCVGTWSDCTSDCEAAGQRIWHERTAQSGDGAACPAASSCSPDECPPAISGAPLIIIVIVLNIMVHRTNRALGSDLPPT